LPLLSEQSAARRETPTIAIYGQVFATQHPPVRHAIRVSIGTKSVSGGMHRGVSTGPNQSRS
jgi:hypothetical protein